MNILVINCGSSSLKYQLINMANEEALATGLVERIGMDGSILIQKVQGKDKYVIEEAMENHEDAMKLVLGSLVDETHGVIKSMDEIGAVGHRVVHGGKYEKSVLVNNEVIAYLEECIKLAPLHNPPSITGINASKALMPNTPMVVVFDTAFHQTMPKEASMYGIPYEFYENNKIRKYGFHGTSHKYVSIKAAEAMNQNIEDLKIVTCHIGNGGSVTAVKGGESIDTSMGFTPLEGIMMGTRSGNIDPAVVTYMIDELGYSAKEVNNILNKKSGLLGVSGLSSDFRDIRSAMENGNERAKIAFKMFCYKIRQHIGAYAAIMGGIDCLVFTAGIGENAYEVRSEVCEGLEFLGIDLDKEKNEVRGEFAEIGKEGLKVRVFTIPTNEELMIAKDTLEIVNK